MHDLQERRELPLRIVKASKDLVNGSERIDTLGPAPLPRHAMQHRALSLRERGANGCNQLIGCEALLAAEPPAR
jgi:hypothetical protein